MDLKDFHYFVSDGSGGPWIIFLHGLLGAAANWRRIIPSFEQKFKILAYDQRGHGRSFHPASGYAPEDFAGDLKFMMDSLGISAAHIVGHSMGGRNAFCFAHLHPERVKTLVIEDIGPAASVANGKELVESLRAVPVPFENKKAAKEYLLNEFKDPKLGNFFYTDIKQLPDGRATWSFDLNVVEEIVLKGRGSDRWYELEGLECPTLVIRGEFSDELPKSEFERMKSCNKNVTGIEIKGSGHWIHFDKREEFIRALSDFLSNHP